MINYEENNPPDIDLDNVFTILQKIFPTLDNSEVSFLYHGSYNVFNVRDKFIFRFPDKHFRNEKGKEMIKNESRILNLLKNYVDIEIPEPIFISTENESLYMGYKKISGVSISQCVEHISKRNKIQIATHLSHFLNQLHSQDLIPEIFPEISFSLKAYKLHWKDWYHKTRKEVFPILSTDQKIWVSELFKRFFNNDENFKFKPCIAHCDFDLSNILVNPSNYQIMGIIDFEETKVYDPAVDLLFFDEGEEFMSHLFKNYKVHNYNDLKERMEFFYNHMGLNYLMFGIENKIHDMIKVGISLLIKRMESFKLK